MNEELKKALEREKQLQEIAKSISDPDGNLDFAKLEASEDLEGETRSEKMSSYEKLRNEAVAMREKADALVKAEKEHREYIKSLPANDTVSLDTETALSSKSNLKDTIADGIRGKNLESEMVRIVVAKDVSLASLSKALFVYDPAATPIDNRYPIRPTNLARHEDILAMFNEVRIPAGEQLIRSIEMDPGTVDPEERGRRTADATADANVKANARSYNVKSLHTWQSVPRITLSDHTETLTRLSEELRMRMVRKALSDYLNGPGTGDTITGALAQITNTEAIAANTEILPYLEEKIESMRFAGASPNVLLSDVASWNKLRSTYRKLRFDYQRGTPYTMIGDSGIPIIPCPTMPANTAILANTSYLTVGMRSDIVLEVNPYIRQDRDETAVFLRAEHAFLAEYCLSTSFIKEILELTATNNWVDEKPSS